MAYEQAAPVKNPRCLLETRPAEGPDGLRLASNSAYEMPEPVRLHVRHFELVQPVVTSRSRATCETRFWCAPGPVYEKAQPVELRLADKPSRQPDLSSDPPPMALSITDGARSKSPPPVFQPRAGQHAVGARSVSPPGAGHHSPGARTGPLRPVFPSRARARPASPVSPPRAVRVLRKETDPGPMALPPLGAQTAGSVRIIEEARPAPRSDQLNRTDGVGTAARPPPEARPSPEDRPPPSQADVKVLTSQTQSTLVLAVPWAVVTKGNPHAVGMATALLQWSMKCPAFCEMYELGGANCNAVFVGWEDDKVEEASLRDHMLRHLRCLAVTSVTMVLLMTSGIVLVTLTMTRHSADSTPGATTVPFNVSAHSVWSISGPPDGLPMPTQGFEYGTSGGMKANPSSTNNEDKTAAGVATGGLNDDGIVFGGMGTEPGRFQGPTGVAVGSASGGEIFVADEHNRRVSVHAADGTFLRLFPALLPGMTFRTMTPHDVAMETPAALWVVGRSWRGDHVVKYSRTGEVLGGFSLNQTESHRGIAFDSQRGNVYVTEAATTAERSRVVVTRADGTLVRTLVHPAMPAPYGVAIDEVSGRCYVSDVSAHSILVFDNFGNFLFKFGSYGVDKGQLSRPSGICTAGPGHLIVASQTLRRVELFTTAGEYVRTVTASVNTPDGVAVGPGGRLVVTDSAHDLVVIFPMYLLDDEIVAVGPRGRLVVTDSASDKVIIFPTYDERI
ncbi:hypothetical protein Bbelb_077530 [Branchiostoma belcheri]|nr:hypothetical protein Bbelb_077530 [Branchiostoma belcheri]